ncbi:hypothetical protein ES705_38471 [subsurface metagenome]
MGLKGADYIAMPYPLSSAVRLSDDIIVEPGQFSRFAGAIIEGVV